MKCTKEYRMSFDQKAREIVSQMTFEEKVHMMAGHEDLKASMGGGDYNSHPYAFGGCERLGVPELKFCDGPRGIVSGHSTCFPVSMCCGATFNTDLEREIGSVIGKETLANGGNYFGGVCMNIPYNPGAGRSQESFGEDSYHMGEMAAALMEGVQDENVIACGKHFAFNSMERSRFKVSVTADKRTEQEVYFPHFRKFVKRGGASIMNAYNLYQGTKCGHNPYLLRKVLKGDWDFDGFVISDFFWGVKSAEGGISGGCDVEMHVRQHYKEKKIRKAIADGKITVENLNEACLRIVRTTLAFDAARKDQNMPDPSVLASREHVTVARRAAEEGITLLQNKDSLLPLPEKAKIVLVGDLADVENIGDHGSSKVRPPYVRTMLGAMKEFYPDHSCTFIPTKEVRKRIDEIRSADAVIIAAGMNHGDEGEYIFTIGGDRKSLELHRKDLDMIHTAAAANPNTAVVLMGGNVIMTHSFQDEVKAILFAYYPGQEGGSAIMDILFGKVNPSGKLPFAIAQSEKDYPQVKWNSKEQAYGYYHGYHKLDKEGKGCDFPYGFGLSYTTFSLGTPTLISNDEQKAVFSVPVTNTGDRSGKEVVQLYAGFPEATVDRPVRTLAAFAKIALEPGETRDVRLEVNKEELGWYNEKTNSFVQDSAYEAFISTNERDVPAKGIRF